MKLEILLVEDYAHPIGKVWAALTDPAALAEWLMVNDFEPQVGKALYASRRAQRRVAWMDGLRGAGNGATAADGLVLAEFGVERPDSRGIPA